MRGKVLVALILDGGSAEAAAFEQAFPGLGECGAACGVEG